ncbi:MAG: DUF1573 domain-containing protein [Peptococcaceae bacterium]|jgi:hypothetical protein|nr:DUF1573 domain-containing protein [Peptococcaceae bacterium]MDH7526127.1 DUF1573 domain-containing protein [Peptococcaceae bacterium]
MAELHCEDFQQTVSNFLLRHQSILDLLSKSFETMSRVNRAITKSVTTCGCLRVHAEKKPLPREASLQDLKELFSSHLEGQLCDNCREIIINEMGKNLFYFTALCDTLGIGLQEVLEQENSKVMTLGKFNMT